MQEKLKSLTKVDILEIGKMLGPHFISQFISIY